MSWTRPERIRRTRFHKIRTTGRRGCSLCQIIFNGVAYYGIKDRSKSSIAEKILGRVEITLRRGHMPVVSFHGVGPFFVRVELFSPKGKYIESFSFVYHVLTSQSPHSHGQQLEPRPAYQSGSV